MRIAVASDDNRGLDGVVSEHFGRCPCYTLADVESGEVKGIEVVNNPFYGNHGQTGEVPEFIRSQKASVMIAGGMGPKAIGFFQQFGIEVVTGTSGRIGDAISSYLNGRLSGAQSCMEDTEHLGEMESGSDKLSALREEAVLLQKQLAEMEKKITELGQKY